MAHLRNVVQAAAILACLLGVTFVTHYSLLYISPYISFVHRFSNSSAGYPYSFAGWCRNNIEWQEGPNSNYTWKEKDMSSWGDNCHQCFPGRFFEYGTWIGFDLELYSANVDLWRHSSPRRCLDFNGTSPLNWKMIKNQTCPCRVKRDKPPREWFLVKKWAFVNTTVSRSNETLNVEVLSKIAAVMFSNASKNCSDPFDWVFDTRKNYYLIQNVTLSQHIHLTLGEWAFGLGVFDQYFSCYKFSLRAYDYLIDYISKHYNRSKIYAVDSYRFMLNHNYNFKLFKEKTPWWIVALFIATKFIKTVVSILGLRITAVSYLPIFSTAILVSNILFQIFSISFVLEITYFNLILCLCVMITSVLTIVCWFMSVETSEEFNEKILKHKTSLVKNKKWMIFFLAIYRVLIFLINTVAIAWCYSLVEDFVEFFDTFESRHEVSGYFIVVTFFLGLLSIFAPRFLSFLIKRSLISPSTKSLVNVLCVLFFLFLVVLYAYFFLLWKFTVDTITFMSSLFLYMMTMKIARKVFLSASEIFSGNVLYTVGDDETIRFNALMRWMSSCANSEIFADFARLMGLIVILPAFSMICLHLKWIAIMVVIIIICLVSLLWQVLINCESLWTSVSQHIKIKSWNNYDVRYCASGFCPKLKLEFTKKFYEQACKLQIKEIDNEFRNMENAKDRELKELLEHKKLEMESMLKNNQLNLEKMKINAELESKVQIEFQKTMTDLFKKAADTAINSVFDEEGDGEVVWSGAFEPDIRTAVERLFRYTIMYNLSKIRRNGERLTPDGIREVTADITNTLPYEWKKNFALMDKLFSPDWDDHRERLIIEHDLSNEEVARLEEIRQDVYDQVNEQNFVRNRNEEFNQLNIQRVMELKNNVWIRFIANIDSQLKYSSVEFNSEVTVPVVHYEGRVPLGRIDYEFRQGELNVPFTSYYVENIFASTETEACKEAERYFINQGLEMRYSGMHSEHSGEISPGEWQVKMTDKQELHLSTRALNLVDIIVTFLLNKIGCLLSFVFDQIFSFYYFFTGSLQADIVKEFIEFLQTSNYFPISDNQSFEQILLNQNEKVTDNYIEKLSLEQQKNFYMFKDLITINPRNFYKFRARYEVPSAKEIWNAYSLILKSRKVDITGPIEYTSIPLDMVYAKIIRPYMALPEKLPRQLKLYSVRQSLYLVPVDSCAPVEKYMLLEPFKIEKSMCIVLNSIGNNYIAGHETQDCKKLHNGQGCTATYRCKVFSGWQSALQEGRITFLFANLRIDQITLVYENLERTFLTQNCRQEARVPVNDLYYMTSPMGIGKYGILTSANINGLCRLYTAAHVVSVRGDGRTNLGPGQWGEEQVKELDPKAIIAAKNLSVTGEYAVIENGKLGKFYVPRWFRIRNILNQDFLGCVEKLDGEGAMVVLYTTDEVEVKLIAHLDVEKKDLHVQEKQAFIVRIDRESEISNSPVVQPLYNLDTSNVNDFCYTSAPGDSGSPIIVGNALKGIHLGGYDDGTGGAFVGVTYDQNGAHFTSVKKLNNKMVDDSIYNKNQWSDWAKTPEGSLYDWREGDTSVFLERDGKGWRTKKRNGESWSYNYYVTMEDLERAVNNGHFGSDSLFLIDDGQVSGDRDMKTVQTTWTALLDKYHAEASKASEELRGHLEVTMKTYNEITQSMPEDEIASLLRQDACDLLDFKQKVVNELAELKGTILKLKVARDLLERDPEYKRQKKQHELALLKFAEDKSEYHRLMTEYKNLRETRRKLIAEKTEEVQKKVKALTQEKMKIIQNSQKYFAEIKNKQKALVIELTSAEKKLSEMKKVKEVDVDKIEQLKKDLDKLKSLLESYKEDFRKKRNELHRAELGESTKASEEILKKINYFKIELQKINVEKKNFATESTHKITSINLETNQIRKNLKEVLDSKKPPGPASPVKPKFVEAEELSTIKDHLLKISKLNKQGEQIRRVIDLILKDSECKAELTKLSGLANHSIGVFDQHYHGETAYDVKVFTDALKKSLRQRIADMVVTSMFWELKDNVSKSRSLNELEEFQNFVMKYFKDCCEAICEDFDIAQVNIDMDFVERHFDPNFCRNQSINTRYVMITPKMMNADAVLQNMLAASHPFKIQCAFCNQLFICDGDHLGKNSGTLMDLACTLYCQRAKLSELRGHLSDCKQKSSASFYATSANPSVFFSCRHKNKAEAVNKCPLHCEQTLPCIKNYDHGSSAVAVVLDGSTSWMDAICLFATLFRMSKDHEMGKCNHEFNEKMFEKIKSMVSLKRGKNAVRYGNFFFDLSDFSEMEKAKFLVNLNEVSVDLPVVEIVTGHCSNHTMLEDTYQMLRNENKAMRELLEKVLSESRIDRQKFEQRVATLEQQQQQKAIVVNKDETPIIEKNEEKDEKKNSEEKIENLENRGQIGIIKKVSVSESSSVTSESSEIRDLPENQGSVIDELPELIPMKMFILLPSFKPAQNYKGPRVPSIAEKVREIVKIEDTPFGTMSYASREDVIRLYQEATPEDQKRILFGLRQSIESRNSLNAFL